MGNEEQVGDTHISPNRRRLVSWYFHSYGGTSVYFNIRLVKALSSQCRKIEIIEQSKVLKDPYPTIQMTQ